MKKKIVVTGAAGFIGFHVCKRLLKENYSIIGIDNLNSYYDVELKESRLNKLNELSTKNHKEWKFFKVNLTNDDFFDTTLKDESPNIVIHLAAQAGVRYSLKNPRAYIESNIIGFQNILDFCKNNYVENFIYASSSSVYGGNLKVPFSEKDPVNHPVSLYAATKKANELFAHTYSHLYEIPSTALRFFTVYGPWGRPDMAPMIFTKAILSKEPINIFNKGDMFRDFTFIDDVSEIIFELVEKPSTKNNQFNRESPDPSSSWAPHRIFNIGNSNSINLMRFIEALEKELGLKAIKNFKPMQPGDVTITSADTSAIESWTGKKPNTTIEKGVHKFINWYKEYYKI